MTRINTMSHPSQDTQKNQLINPKITKTDIDKDIEFQIYYGYAYENLNKRFYAAIDNITTFILLVMGASIMMPITNNWLSGFAIALISAMSFVLKPGVKSEQSKQQAKRYSDLILDMKHGTPDIINKLKQITDTDTDGVGILQNVALTRAGMMLGLNTQKDKLSCLELIAARLAGDYMHRTNN